MTRMLRELRQRQRRYAPSARYKREPMRDRHAPSRAHRPTTDRAANRRRRRRRWRRMQASQMRGRTPPTWVTPSKHHVRKMNNNKVFFFWFEQFASLLFCVRFRTICGCRYFGGECWIHAAWLACQLFTTTTKRFLMFSFLILDQTIYHHSDIVWSTNRCKTHVWYLS